MVICRALGSEATLRFGVYAFGNLLQSAQDREGEDLLEDAGRIPSTLGAFPVGRLSMALLSNTSSSSMMGRCSTASITLSEMLYSLEFEE